MTTHRAQLLAGAAALAVLVATGVGVAVAGDADDSDRPTPSTTSTSVVTPSTVAPAGPPADDRLPASTTEPGSSVPVPAQDAAGEAEPPVVVPPPPPPPPPPGPPADVCPVEPCLP